MTTSTVDHLTRRLLDWFETQSWAAELGALTHIVLGELALGEPVDPARIAARAGMPASDVLRLLRESPAEWDADGRLVGFGVTLRPTRHRFEVEFFSSPQAASDWQAADPEGIVVSVADGSTLAGRLFAHWMGPAHQAEHGASSGAA